MDRLRFLIPLGIIAIIEIVQGDPLEPWIWMLPVGWFLSGLGWDAKDRLDELGGPDKVQLRDAAFLIPMLVAAVVWGFYVIYAMWMAYRTVGA